MASMGAMSLVFRVEGPTKADVICETQKIELAVEDAMRSPLTLEECAMVSAGMTERALRERRVREIVRAAVEVMTRAVSIKLVDVVTS